MEHLLDLDLESLGQGRSIGLTPTQHPIFCVCTHGRHDACCAELGRPVAATLARNYAASTWEVSHVGGDRFAANVVVLPDGLYYGRVEPDSAPELVKRHLEGHLTPELLRGRSAYPFAIQAGEHYLRQELGETRINAFMLTRRRRAEPGSSEAGESWHLDFTSDSGSWTVVVEASVYPASLLTCRALVPSPSPRFRLLGIDAQPPSSSGSVSRLQSPAQPADPSAHGEAEVAT